MRNSGLKLLAAALVAFGFTALHAESGAEPAQAANSPAAVNGAKAAPAATENKAELIARGAKLAKQCDECHTLRDADGKPVVGEFGGGRPLLGSTVSANITPGPQGISYFDENMLRQVLREARVNARKLNVMNPVLFRKLTDDDIHAVWTFLRQVPEVNHRVDNTEEPTPCKKCRETHGGGELN